MRLFTLLFIGALTLARGAHACESLLGRMLKPEDLRPNMVVRIDQPSPVLEEAEIAETLEPGFGQHPDFGLDTYLEHVGVRGQVLVRRVSYHPNDTLEIEVVGLADLERTAQGDFRVRPGAEPKRLVYGHRLPDGTHEAAKFQVLSVARGDGEYFHLEPEGGLAIP